ncbi:MAG: glycine-rich domain-containing protein, partial [Hyphomicrobiaceae bacterium]
MARTSNIAARLAFIDSYQWPKGLIPRLEEKHPTLSGLGIARIEQALRQYFRAYVKGGRRYVSMPSQAADDLWHEFILYTKAYDAFCRKAFGRFLHHTPAVVLTNGRKRTNEGLRRVWWQCCKEEGIDPRSPKSLPALFA